ncbi:hypothetical protein ACU4I5_02215 [Ensifer adhaerens]
MASPRWLAVNGAAGCSVLALVSSVGAAVRAAWMGISILVSISLDLGLTIRR